MASFKKNYCGIVEGELNEYIYIVDAHNIYYKI